MEIEQRTPLMPKNLWGIVEAIFYMVKKASSKNIPWFELRTILKRSTKLAGKAIGNLHIDHQTLTCRPNDIRTTFIAPVEYQFSCSNTPMFYTKRKTNRRTRKHNQLTVNNVKKMFDVLNTYEAASLEPENFQSPLTLLGFGLSPNVRRLRVTDSPFPVEVESGGQVDTAAEEFIKNFYEELRLQKNRAAVEPPSPFCYRKWGQVR